jgi:hypothetical protein
MSKQTLPWIDYCPNFLDPARAQKVFDWISSLNLKPETGSCTDTPTHDSIQWGPRQAYLTCVAPDVRIQSSGPIPIQLSKLHAEIEQRYQVIPPPPSYCCLLPRGPLTTGPGRCYPSHPGEQSPGDIDVA